jgi:hypothetical protein
MATKVERTVKYTTYYDDDMKDKYLDQVSVDYPHINALLSMELGPTTATVVDEITSEVTRNVPAPDDGAYYSENEFREMTKKKGYAMGLGDSDMDPILNVLLGN